MKIRIIGDVHGKLERYLEIIIQCLYSICVGDFGFKQEWDWHLENIPRRIYGHHWINPGNHDYPWQVGYPTTGDYKVIKPARCPNTLMTIRGANSIDKHLRTNGVDWFESEELTYHEGLVALDVYSDVKPNVVVTHDCPMFLKERWFGYTEKTMTNQLLDAAWETHKPAIWVFGHHHQNKIEVIDGCTFICLAELEYIDIDLNDLTIEYHGK
jgi:predicted phosphodiesterase